MFTFSHRVSTAYCRFSNTGIFISALLVVASTTALDAQQFFDSFADGNFTAAPAWSGTTTNWTIAANSTAGPGATGSQTLRLDATSATAGTQQLRAQPGNWGTAQQWAFWFGRRAQSATVSNRLRIWLYANETGLTSATVDGYALVFGDDTGNDELRLARIDDGIETAIATSATAVPNNLDDYGVAVRIVRTAEGRWRLYASTLATLASGGGVAADINPATAPLFLQATAADAIYTPSVGGYVGLVASHTSGANPRTAVEFDQFSLSTALSVVAAGSLVVSEDSTANVAVTVSGGSSDLLVVSATSSNQTLLPDAAIVQTNSTSPTTHFVLSPTADRHGTTAIVVTATDRDGFRASTTFVLTVLSVNDAPSFAAGGAIAALDEDGAQVYANQLTAISAGPADEEEQSVQFVVSNSNPALFDVQPTISPTGALTFTPAMWAQGTAIVSVYAVDGGGTANGGVSTSAVQTFAISVGLSPATRLRIASVSPMPVRSGQFVNIVVEMLTAAGTLRAATSATVLGLLYDNSFLQMQNGSTQATLNASASTATLSVLWFSSSTANIAIPIAVVDNSSAFAATTSLITIRHAVPSALGATVENDNVLLSWEAPDAADITGYAIFRGTSANVLAEIGTSATTVYVDSTAAQGVMYFYAVESVSGIFRSGRTPALSTSVLAPPASVAATPSTAGIVLSWASSSPNTTTGYRVLRGSTTSNLLPFADTDTTTVYLDTTAEACTHYYYAIQTLAGELASGNSTSIHAQIELPESIVIVAPNGGEAWHGGQTKEIVWQSTGCTPSPTVAIEYSANGVTWNPIAVTPNSGSYLWTVPDIAAQARVRVVGIDAGDTSNAAFAISPTPVPAIAAVQSSIAASSCTGSESAAIVRLVLSDPIYPAALLTVVSTSSNQSVVSDASIVRRGSTAATTVFAVTPNTAEGGEARLTFTVSNSYATSSTTVTLTLAPGVEVSANADTTICLGISVQLAAVAVSPVGGVLFSWASQAGELLSNAASIVVSPVTTTTYTVAVHDANGCIATARTTVSITPKPVAAASPHIAICAGSSTVLTASGGVSYAWSPATGLSSTTAAVVTASPSTTTTYTVVVRNAAGCESSTAVTVTVLPPSLDIRVVLEGPSTGGGMGEYLHAQGMIPESQPYSVAPFSYAGTEKITTTNSQIVDWVLVELRTTSGTVVGRKAALLLSNGHMVNSDGSALRFAGAASVGSYRVAVYHRNHLGVVSAAAISADGDCTASYDFTTSATSAWQASTPAQKEVSSGTWGMIAGDANSDGIVNATDRVVVRRDSGLFGYRTTDFSLDGIVNALDRVIPRNNVFSTSQMP